MYVCAKVVMLGSHVHVYDVFLFFVFFLIFFSFNSIQFKFKFYPILAPR